MSDHSKRNWQRKMHDRADLAAEACDLSQLPPVPGLAETVRQMFKDGYKQGYRDGRDSVKTDGG